MQVKSGICQQTRCCFARCQDEVNSDPALNGMVTPSSNCDTRSTSVVMEDACSDDYGGGGDEILPLRQRSKVGAAGKPFHKYVGKSKATITNQIFEFLERGATEAGFSDKRDPDLITDAIVDRKNKLDKSKNNGSTNVEERQNDILKALLETFFVQVKSPDIAPREKYRTLSVVEPGGYTLTSINELCKSLFPSLDVTRKITEWHWRNARAHFAYYGSCGYQPPQKAKRSSFYKKDELHFAVMFLYSKECLHSVAYGTHDIKLSNSTTLTLPSLLRWQTHKVLYQSYQLLCNAKSQIPVKRTTFYAIINIASKKDDVALHALDSVGEKCGTQNFKAWRKLVRVVCGNNRSLCSALTTLVTSTEDFLRHEFKDHLNKDEENTEEVCNHSMSYAFNNSEGEVDQDERIFPKTCQKCMLPQLLVESTRCAINELLESDKTNYLQCRECVLSLKEIGLHNETRKSLHLFLDKREDQMLTLITHLIRSKHEDPTFDKITAELKDDEVFLIFDYKMKLLPMYHRESQASFFGKRGITWLGFLLVRKKTRAEMQSSSNDSKTKYVTVFYDIISDDGKEDGESVINILTSVLKDYKNKQENSHIGKCSIGSDGAGYFSGSDLFIACASMGKWTGIYVTMHVVSEAGQGKSRVDNHFAVSQARTNIVFIFF